MQFEIPISPIIPGIDKLSQVDSDQILETRTGGFHFREIIEVHLPLASECASHALGVRAYLKKIIEPLQRLEPMLNRIESDVEVFA